VIDHRRGLLHVARQSLCTTDKGNPQIEPRIAMPVPRYTSLLTVIDHAGR
jgi:hypothetical protein